MVRIESNEVSLVAGNTTDVDSTLVVGAVVPRSVVSIEATLVVAAIEVSGATEVAMEAILDESWAAAVVLVAPRSPPNPRLCPTPDPNSPSPAAVEEGVCTCQYR